MLSKWMKNFLNRWKSPSKWMKNFFQMGEKPFNGMKNSKFSMKVLKMIVNDFFIKWKAYFKTRCLWNNLVFCSAFLRRICSFSLGFTTVWFRNCCQKQQQRPSILPTSNLNALQKREQNGKPLTHKASFWSWSWYGTIVYVISFKARSFIQVVRW